MSRQRVVALSTLLGVLAAANGARADDDPPPPPPPGSETHDGVYLRLGLGLGYLKSSGSMTSSGALKLSGTAWGLDVAVGGAVSQDLILFGEFTFMNVGSPDVMVDSGSVNSNGATFDHIGIGPGIAYYIEPANVYLSGALIFGKLQIQNGDTVTAQTKAGLGANFMVGKEWWVSPQWGLGAAFQLMFASNKDGGEGATYSTVGGALAFSATCN